MKIFGCFAAFIVAVSISAKVFAADEPDVHAYGAVAIELSTGRVLWEKEAHKQLPMASTTKIMTAILTLESCETSEIATVSSKAAAAPAVKLGLIKGEKISVRDLLHALMLQSSNDAAVVIAEHVGGSVENFCDLMTLKAKSIGAKDTSYKTPNGLDAEGHFSTAYDLAIITRYALENKDFRDLINTKTYTAKSDKRTFSLVNKNRFLYEYEGAFGVKTGYTGNAGNCFVGAAKKDGMEVITVVLGSGWGTAGKTRKFTDTKNIMNYSFKTYDMKNIINEGDYAGVAEISRSKTKQIEFCYPESVSFPLKEEEEAKVLVVPNEIKAPIAKGEQIATVKIYSDYQLLKEFPVFAQENIERHDFKTSLEKVLCEFFGLATWNKTEVCLPEF